MPSTGLKRISGLTGHGGTKETALRETRDVLLSETAPFKTVVSFNTVCIYTNRS
jgi:hypothetical protein